MNSYQLFRARFDVKQKLKTQIPLTRYHIKESLSEEEVHEKILRSFTISFKSADDSEQVTLFTYCISTN